MKQLFQPAGWVLLGQMALVGLFLGQTGRLRPVSVKDTPLYTAFSWESLPAILGNIRAPGYAAFLKVVAPANDFAFVPVAHYVIFCLGVLIFWGGLKGLGIANWPRSWVASALLYPNILHGYVVTVASDTLAAAMAVAAVGLLFLALVDRRYLVPLALCVMGTYLVRPAYLALVVQLPLLGIAVQMSRRLDRPPIRELMRTAIVLLLISCVPLLSYCTLRNQVVGRFGVVASGGFNLIGIAGQFLDAEMADSLSDDLRPLAIQALTHRPPEDENEVDLMADAPVLNYQRIENRYDWTIWDVFYPAAEQTESDEVSSVNSRLRRLAQAIIRERPTMYAIYLLKAFRRAVFKIVGDSVLNPYSLGLCLLIAGGILFRMLKQPPEARAGQGSDSKYGLITVMTLTTFSYAVCQMLVVILVCPPLGRMTDAMALFVPALLMAVLVGQVSDDY